MGEGVVLVFKRKASFGIMMALLLVSMLVLAFKIQPVKGSTITVPDDYSTIQAAINAASENDTIFVRNGTYVENVVVNKTVSLEGESVEGTVIDGGGSGTPVNITANGVNVSEFTIRNSGTYPNVGILLYHASHCNIVENNITYDNVGVYLEHYSNYNTVLGNNITNNGKLANNLGVYLTGSFNNNISGNIMTKNDWGIQFWDASNNTLSGNNITANNAYGVDLTLSSNNTVSGNNISNNECGIYLRFSSGNEFFHNNFVDNAQQVSFYASGGVNIWDDGYPNGNYWSNYTDVDLHSGPDQNETGADGIWDHPYVIDAYNQDNYPIVPEFPSAIVLPLFTAISLLGLILVKKRTRRKTA